ncbi:MAG: conserved rane protein of unknown function [Blastococcus sp.]|jgi:hypothetical protein|nr:conserved rane protein of unknown function [Blastococcus sp.]
MSSPTGSDPDYPQGGAPQGQPGWSAPQQPTPGYNAPQPTPGYSPAPSSYSGAPNGYGAPTGQRPGMVTAAGVIGIVWGALGLLFGLIGLAIAFAFGAVYGLLLLISVAVAAALLWAGIQVIQGKSPRLLLLISYIAIGINLLTMIWAITQGASIFTGLLGFILPGVIVFLLLNAQSKQYYASRGITY